MKINIFTLAIIAIPVGLISLSFTKPAVAAGLACTDTDGGQDIFTPGSITTTTQYDAQGNLISLGETVADVCMAINPTNGMWVASNTGTHLQEASCTDTTTGSITLTVHQCTNGCSNGACNPVTTPVSTVTSKKVEDHGISSFATENSIIVKGITLYVTPTTVIRFNDGLKSLQANLEVEYKGFKNTDGSVTLTKIELRKI